ncbi:MAG: phosphoadenylyl-sulfate reductase [Candidatus Dormibacteria bacterium]
MSALIDEAVAGLSYLAPEEVLEWGLRTFARDRIALCTSFQAAGMAVLDMALRIDPQLKVFTVDSGRLPAETLELIDEVRDHYRINIEVLYPDASEVSELVSDNGVNLFYRSPELRLGCCEVRKVRPLKRRLAGLDAWITGLRQGQGPQRVDVAEVEVDLEHDGMVKLNPLARWSRERVREYISEHRVPMNRLYAQGYGSIGCAPCTRPVEPGEDPRAGRWWWEAGDKECGIHYAMRLDADGNPTVGLARRAGPLTTTEN